MFNSLQDALTHKNCGGVFEQCSSRGLTIHGYRCSRCNHQVEIDFGDELRQDHDALMERLRERFPASPLSTACGSSHVEGPDGVCLCGEVRFRSDDCPTCGQEWYREEKVKEGGDA